MDSGYTDCNPSIPIITLVDSGQFSDTLILSSFYTIFLNASIGRIWSLEAIYPEDAVHYSDVNSLFASTEEYELTVGTRHLLTFSTYYIKLTVPDDFGENSVIYSFTKTYENCPTISSNPTSITTFLNDTFDLTYELTFTACTTTATFTSSNSNFVFESSNSILRLPRSSQYNLLGTSTWTITITMEETVNSIKKSDTTDVTITFI